MTLPPEQQTPPFLVVCPVCDATYRVVSPLPTRKRFQCKKCQYRFVLEPQQPKNSAGDPPLSPAPPLLNSDAPADGTARKPWSFRIVGMVFAAGLLLTVVAGGLYSYLSAEKREPQNARLVAREVERVLPSIGSPPPRATVDVTESVAAIEKTLSTAAPEANAASSASQGSPTDASRFEPPPSPARAEKARKISPHPELPGAWVFEGVDGPVGDLLAVSPDGKRFLTTQSNEIVLWNLLTREGSKLLTSDDLQKLPKGRYDSPSWKSAQFSAVGDYLLLNTVVGTDLGIYAGSSVLVTIGKSDPWFLFLDKKLRSSPRARILNGGRQLLFGNAIFEIATRKLWLDLEKEDISAAGVSEDQQMLAIAFTDGRMKLWNVGDPNPRKEIVGSTRRIEHLAFSADNRQLHVANGAASGYGIGALLTWNLAEEPAQLANRRDGVGLADFNGSTWITSKMLDKKGFATFTFEPLDAAKDSTTFEVPSDAHVEPDAVCHFFKSGNTSFLLDLNLSVTVRRLILDRNTSAPAHSVVGGWVLASQRTDEGRIQNILLQRDPRLGTLRPRYTVQPAMESDMEEASGTIERLSANATHVVAQYSRNSSGYGGVPSRVVGWDLATGKPSFHGSGVSGVYKTSLSENADRLAVAMISANKETELSVRIPANLGKAPIHLKAPRALGGKKGVTSVPRVQALAFSHDAAHLAVHWSHNQSSQLIQLWSLRDRPTLLGELPFPETLYQFELVVHPDGTLVGGVSGTELFLWDVASQQRLIFAPLAHQANQMLFAPDGRALLTLHKEGPIVAHDLQSKQIRWTLKTPGIEPSRAVFSPDGSRLAVMADEGLIAIYRASPDLAQPPELLAMGLTHGSRKATAIRFSPTDNSLAVGQRDGGLSLWDIEPASK